ncbi:hypothetical protein [Emiliania huxleyi virus 99B1]|nr:hypothetical protein [Emiliania huxleyi virus 99B1]
MSTYNTSDVYLQHLPDLSEVQRRVALRANKDAREWDGASYALPSRDPTQGYVNKSLSQVNPKVLLAMSNAYMAKDERNSAASTAQSAASSILNGNYDAALYELSSAMKIVAELKQNAYRDDQSVANIYKNAHTSLIYNPRPARSEYSVV